MPEFQAILLEGLYYRDEKGRLVVKDERAQQTQVVEDVLTPLVDEDVQLALHHFPPNGIEEGRWGGGCCMWEKVGLCPAGHHEHPDVLINVHGRGVLRRDEDRWFLDQFGGGSIPLPFPLLDGHYARVVVATVFDAEKMQEALAAHGGDLEQVQALGAQVQTLKGLAEQLKGLTKGGK